jgi:hypothetical protein
MMEMEYDAQAMRHAAAQAAESQGYRTRVKNLEPGTMVKYPGARGRRAVVIAVHHPHPYWPTLSLVVWRMPHGWSETDRFSLDALDPEQMIEDTIPEDRHTRTENVRRALTEMRWDG